MQCRDDDLGEAIAVLAHSVDTCPQPGRLRRCQQLGRLGAVFFVGTIQLVEQEQIAKVKKHGPGFVEIKIAAVPERVGTAVVKKRPVAAFGLGHDIRVGSRSIGGCLEQLGIDAVSSAILENQIAERILTNQPGGCKRDAGV